MKIIGFTVLLALGAGLPAAARAPVAADVRPLQGAEYRQLAGKARVDLGRAYAGRVVLVVNTASKCGFTPQYEALEAMHAKYQARGFAVLGFPSNDFLGQEPGSEQQIREFCTLTYGVKFPLFEKVHVKGRDATPLYQRLRAASGASPAWNFHKYLVGRDGRVAASYGSRTRPDDPALLAKLEALLAAPAPAPRQ